MEEIFDILARFNIEGLSELLNGIDNLNELTVEQLDHLRDVANMLRANGEIGEDAFNQVNNTLEDTISMLEGVEGGAQTATRGFGSFAGGIRNIATATGVFAIINRAIEIAVDLLRQFQPILDLSQTAFNALQIVVSDLFNTISNAVEPVRSALSNAINNPVETARNLFNGLIDNIVERGRSLLEFYQNIGVGVLNVLRGNFSEARANFTEAGSEFVDVLTGVDNSAERIANIASEIVSYGEEVIEQASNLTQLNNAATRAERERAQLQLEFQQNELLILLARL